jgi:hypothetical protein
LDKAGAGLIDTLNNEFLARQSVVVAPPDPTDAECAAGSSCFDIGSRVKLLAGGGYGAVKLGQLFADVDARALFDAAVKQIGPPQNWQCGPAPELKRNACKFVLRAERLNVFPNALQLVWLTENSDGASTGAVATEAAYGDSTNPDRVANELCTAQHGLRIEHGNERPFVHVSSEESIPPGPALVH